MVWWLDLVCPDVSGYREDPRPLIEKSRASDSGGRVPPSFLHQGIITGLTKL